MTEWCQTGRFVKRHYSIRDKKKRRTRGFFWIIGWNLMRSSGDRRERDSNMMGSIQRGEIMVRGHLLTDRPSPKIQVSVLPHGMLPMIGARQPPQKTASFTGVIRKQSSVTSLPTYVNGDSSQMSGGQDWRIFHQPRSRTDPQQLVHSQSTLELPAVYTYNTAAKKSRSVCSGSSSPVETNFRETGSILKRTDYGNGSQAATSVSGSTTIALRRSPLQNKRRVLFKNKVSVYRFDSDGDSPCSSSECERLNSEPRDREVVSRTELRQD